MEIIKEAYVEETIYYTLDYIRKDEPGAGFSFPCDEEGNPKKLNDAAQENLEYCIKNSGIFHPRKVVKHIDRYRHRETGRCSCGEAFELENQYLGACQCPKCGKWYNLFGQELLPPDQWGEDCVDDCY